MRAVRPGLLMFEREPLDEMSLPGHTGMPDGTQTARIDLKGLRSSPTGPNAW
jgi:hypothetical protein